MRTRLLPLSCLLGMLVTLAPSGRAQSGSAEAAAVLEPVQALFAGMARRDPAAIRAAALPGATMVLMRDGKPTQTTLDAFADRIGKPGARIEERIHDPLIRVDHDLAVIWAPFDFFVEGKLDHCGTDLFNLVRAGSAWTIASVADTGTHACPAH